MLSAFNSWSVGQRIGDKTNEAGFAHEAHCVHEAVSLRSTNEVSLRDLKESKLRSH